MRAYYLLSPGIQRAKEISVRLEDIEVLIGDVIERPGSIARDANIARAMMLDYGFLEAVRGCLTRHCHGDWRDACEEIRQQNDEALEAEKNGKLIDSLFSVYDINGTEIFIITEFDRSVTTILFPDEY